MILIDFSKIYFFHVVRSFTLQVDLLSRRMEHSLDSILQVRFEVMDIAMPSPDILINSRTSVHSESMEGVWPALEKFFVRRLGYRTFEKRGLVDVHAFEKGPAAAKAQTPGHGIPLGWPRLLLCTCQDSMFAWSFETNHFALRGRGSHPPIRYLEFTPTPCNFSWDYSSAFRVRATRTGIRTMTARCRVGEWILHSDLSRLHVWFLQTQAYHIWRIDVLLIAFYSMRV